jgi:hypothetical protein
MLTPELELEDEVVVPELDDFFEPHAVASPATAKIVVAMRARRRHFFMGDGSFLGGC